MEPKQAGLYLFFTLLTLGGFGYSYLTQQNDLTEMRMEIPELMRDMESLRQEIAVLEYQVEAFQNPRNLLQIAMQNQYRHLKLPRLQEVAFLDTSLYEMQHGQVGMDSCDGVLPEPTIRASSKAALASQF